MLSILIRARVEVVGGGAKGKTKVKREACPGEKVTNCTQAGASVHRGCERGGRSNRRGNPGGTDKAQRGGLDRLKGEMSEKGELASGGPLPRGGFFFPFPEILALHISVSLLAPC